MSALELLRKEPGFKAVAAACVDKKTGKPVSVQAVYKWLKNGVPPEHVLTVERLSEGRADRHALREDIYGPKPDGWISPFLVSHNTRELAHAPG